MSQTPAARWIRFLRQYGPIPRNDNMYDEHIQRSAKRAGVRPLVFSHPLEDELVSLFRDGRAGTPVSVVLTGTAGDGKSHLCRKIWQQLGGDDAHWGADDIYYAQSVVVAGRTVTVHVIRDLTAMPMADDGGRYRDKGEVLQAFCRSLFATGSADVFLVAANDGQLVETLQKLADAPEVVRTREVVETLLVEGRRTVDGVRLELFNLSRVPCTDLFDLAFEAFTSHEGWRDCYDFAEPEGFFGPRCPIRRNYELLGYPLVRSRLRALFELCDCSDLHVPIRRVLLLLANAVLGHPDARDRLMQAVDVPGIILEGTVARASLFNNVFGGNLSEVRRESLEVFEYLNRFRIGHETSNRVDNILIFGEADDQLREYFDALLRNDSFYGADASYQAAQRDYVEGADERADGGVFLEMLVSQRRGLFFKIPQGWEEDLALWELTVFKYAGEYLTKVVWPLRQGSRVERAILARLVRGLNRIFVGMLVNSEQELLLATSISFSTSKVSQVLEDRIPVSPRLSERIEFALESRRPELVVQFAPDIRARLTLNLVRYEFLTRVAEGALPGSFSRECYEDILAFKSRLLACLTDRRRLEVRPESDTVSFHLLGLDTNGGPAVEVLDVHG